MRVLLLTTDAYGGHGGIALYNRDLADALAAMPDVSEVVVVPRTLPFAPEGVPQKVKFIAGAAAGKSDYILAALGAAAGKFDLVICGHINLLPLAALLNLKLRAPLAMMVYGIDVWKPCSAMRRCFLRRIDAIWSISAITRDKMMDWSGLPATKFVLLPNAIHLERYGMAEKRSDLLELYGLTGHKVILTLARLPSLERYKGVDEVLEVLPMLLAKEPSLKYLVAGDGDDRGRLEAKTESLGLGDRVVFAGFVDEALKADMFRLADAFVMPGRGEGFGFVFLEALACGIPVVGSSTDGSREALRDGKLGELVDPDDPTSIRRGILDALSKPKSIQPGLSYFDWSHFQDRVGVVVAELRTARDISSC